MNKFMTILQWFVANYKKMLVIIIAILSATAMVLKMIPGQPGEQAVESAIETLQKIEGEN